jgi:hypothetical protein
VSRSAGWIGVDLDGTIAHYDRFVGPLHIGDPIPAMVNRVKRWLTEGREVRIFTARVSEEAVKAEVEKAIKAWCKRHIGQELAVTCIKDYQMIELYDDRAIQVEKNTGRLIGESTRGI